MAENRDIAIEVTGLRTRYGDREVLKGLTFAIPKAKTTVILGGSGCGKSTLLKHLIGLLKPSEGSIKILGQEITGLTEPEMDEVRKKMGVSFQGSALLNSITIAENVALPIKEHTKIDIDTMQTMIRIKLNLVGLPGFGHFYPSQLSGGMKKRAGIARALALDPALLFFDEPSAGLDPVTAAGLDNLILGLQKNFKMTIVVVTHELASVFAIADYVIMLDKGQVLFFGPLEDLKASDHPRIKQFLDRRWEEEEMSEEDQWRAVVEDKIS
jgi:phospholipid/cholesterol/gamma-HCH transport system ATP-binding protein